MSSKRKGAQRERSVTHLCQLLAKATAPGIATLHHGELCEGKRVREGHADCVRSVSLALETDLLDDRMNKAHEEKPHAIVEEVAAVCARETEERRLHREARRERLRSFHNNSHKGTSTMG